MSSSMSRYVSLDLLLYLESGQTMPFHIFPDVVMPDFRHHLSNGKQFLPTSEVVDNNFCFSDLQLQGMFDEILDNLNYIKRACGRVKQWEDHINKEIEGLIMQSMDGAFKEETETKQESCRGNFLYDKLQKTLSVVSMLKSQIFSPPEFSSVNLEYSESFKRFSFCMRDRSKSPINLPDQNIIDEMIKERSKKEIEAIYNDLDVTSKMCLLCFSVFPENAVIKKKVLVHWWVGEGFIDSPSSGDKTAEQTGNEFFKKFISKGIIEPVHKKRRTRSENCKMDPLIRSAVITLAKRAGFLCFDAEGYPTANLCESRRVCLVKTVEGSSLRQLTYSFDLKQEKVRTLFNVNEPYLDFRVDFFSQMKYLRVLQLGRWQASAQQHVEVDDGGFLKGLKKMKHLRYFSLRGISGIIELPDAICKLCNLRILNLNGCHNLEKLPDGIGSLKMLTHLDMSECYFISHMPKGIALLLQLQVLKGFVVRQPKKGVECCKLHDLAKLENLRKLLIHVEREYGKAEEQLRSLPQIKSLRSLSVAWSGIYTSPNTTIARASSIKESIKSCSKRTSFSAAQATNKPTPSPASLEKLGLLYLPGSEMPCWLNLFNLENLKKLYVREGEQLSDLRIAEYHPQNVRALRLKYLPELQMNWGKLQALFPKLSYLEQVQCPKLFFFPCDQNGEWMRGSAIDEEHA
ncbi:disease resistance RPP13-like protein 4 [Corylus avellana]|uniref:disease resistance RPP13-like protein 4 n=1 Tax=Corylus avellana TaxID=13451 RepID=UPI001E1F3013|nr:disease resistance RPP13-like protein 4 [Corylus avellana]